MLNLYAPGSALSIRRVRSFHSVSPTNRELSLYPGRWVSQLKLSTGGAAITASVQLAVPDSTTSAWNKWVEPTFKLMRFAPLFRCLRKAVERVRLVVVVYPSPAQPFAHRFNFFHQFQCQCNAREVDLKVLLHPQSSACP